ncbi:hypothetical protein [Pseudomonas sp. SG20052]|uniref:hypothetical protein n=1 Tax=Pseudomonas sp. SG20052 TaxID=3074147 RepID=UPI00287F9123|nr:hypothetical protein [Pseudomonas sp. SG20052]WNF56009.1 hypothetical protein RHP74_01620 [Pseudomonas sp. SG20052]
MHIQVITGAGREGDTDRHKHMRSLQEWMGEPAPVHAEAYGTTGLVEILEVRAVGGDNEILVLGCTTEQIQAVLEWQSATEEVTELEDLLIHLVKKARLPQRLAGEGR